MEYLILLAVLPLLIIAFYRLQIARRVEDLPTSPIGAAAQGLTEIKARTVDLNNRPLVVPHLGIPCVWYRYEVEDISRQDGRVMTDARESFDRFYVADSTGICAVDPMRAEVHPKRSKQIQDGSALYKMSWIGIDDSIYILGWLHTLHPRPKTDDEIRNFSITSSSVDTVVKRYGHLKEKLDRITRAPYPGIPFVISTHYEHALIRKLKQQAWFWFIGFFAALVAIFFMIDNWQSLS